MAGLPQVGLEAVITNLPQFTAGARTITSAYDEIDKKSSQVETTTSKLGSSLLNFGKFVAQAGITAFATGLGAAAVTGFQYNNMLQQASARIQAFTKDSELTAQTIELIRTEAAKTPFTFGEMVTAAASLQPVMRASGESLQNLIKDAEILAASNPLQGLEGASFALREAISGDFTSIIERFNLSRVTINRLKDEGVPAIEIVRQAMAEMGFDAELVANMAQTAEGRWSTFSDTMTTFAGIVTQPMFDQMSESLGRLNEALEKNEEGVSAFAENLSSVTKDLAKGLDAWTFVLLDAIPAIEAYNQAQREAAKESGQVSIEVRGAMGQVRGSTESYNAAAGALERWLTPLINTGVEQQVLKTNLQETKVANDDWVASLLAVVGPIYDATAAQQALNNELSKQVGLDITGMTNRQREAYTAYYMAIGNTADIMSRFQIEEEKRKAEEIRKIQEESAKKAGEGMREAFDKAATDIRGIIDSVIKPSLDEVWQPPVDEARFDESARRLATVATSGFGSEWLGQLVAQFGGQDFFQPIIDAMQAGDPEALKNAATNILTTSVTNLWDVGIIEQKVREQLQAQQLRERIIDQVAQELGMEGVNIPMDNITTSAGTMTTAVNTAATSITTAGGGASTATPQFEGVNTALSDISSTINQKLRTAFSNITGFISSQVQPKFGELMVFFNEEFAPAIVNLSETVLPDWSKAMDDVIGKIKDATEYFKGLKTEVEGFTLPEVLQPGSPPPFAIALTDIANAAKVSTAAIATLTQGVRTSSKVFADMMTKTLNPRSIMAGFLVPQGQRADISSLINSLIPEFSGQLESGGFNLVQAIQTGLSRIGSNVGVGQIIDALQRVGLSIESVTGQIQDAFSETQKVIRLQNAAAAIAVGGQFTQFGIAAADRLQARIDILKAIVESGEEGAFGGQIITAVQAQEELNAALAEQASVQNEILDLQRQQADLQWLQQQVSLIQMVRDAGLNVADIFQGITFGLDASIPDIIAATNNVVQAMIDQVDEDLQIASPSKVMIDKARQVMAGFARGMAESVPGIQAAAQSVISGPIVNAPVGGGWMGNQRVTNNYFDMSVNTGASPQAVVYQYEIMRAMVG